MTQTTTRWPEYGGADFSGRSRTRGRELSQVWATWLACIAWQYLVTLTFDPKKVFPVDATLASREAFSWCGQVGRLVRRPVGWLYAVEQGRGGALHAHVLMVGVPAGLGAAPPAIWTQRNGRFHVRPVDDTRRGPLYTTKEAALSGEIVLSDTLRRYYPTGTAVSRVDLCPISDERETSLGHSNTADYLT
jgi:hypothetical protein